MFQITYDKQVDDIIEKFLEVWKAEGDSKQNKQLQIRAQRQLFQLVSSLQR